MTVEFALSDHVEGPRDAPSAHIYREIVRLAQLADRLGFAAIWFSEHHAHAHRGHMPAPLLLALHVADRTRSIHVGTSVICLNLHHPVEMAENLAVVDALTGGRLSIGLGSGSTPSEADAYGIDLGDRAERHGRFAEALEVLEAAWSGEPIAVQGRYRRVECPPILPKGNSTAKGKALDETDVPAPAEEGRTSSQDGSDIRAPTPLHERCWIAAGSVETAAFAGRHGYCLMLPRERSRGYLNPLVDAYQRAQEQVGLPPDHGKVTVGVALYVGETDEAARRDAGAAVAEMVRRNRAERAAVAALPEPKTWEEQLDQALFVAGSPSACIEKIVELRRRVPFTTLDVQPRWSGLSPEMVERSLERFGAEVMPGVQAALGTT